MSDEYEDDDYDYDENEGESEDRSEDESVDYGELSDDDEKRLASEFEKELDNEARGISTETKDELIRDETELAGATVDKSGKIIDPIDKAAEIFRKYLRGCLGEDWENFINNSVTLVKRIERLEKYNMSLLAKAACFNANYNAVNPKNIKLFLNSVSEDDDEPIDIIRYIRFYENVK